MNRIRHVNVGDIIETNEVYIEDWYTRGKHKYEYEVVSVYPFFVLARDVHSGTKRSFSYGELIMLGLECQDAEYEDEKKNRLQNIIQSPRFGYEKSSEYWDKIKIKGSENYGYKCKM